MPNLIGRTLLKNTRMTIPLRSGARLAVDTSQLDIYCRINLDKGVWDGHVLDVCLRLLRPGDVFYDIGANAGVFSVECARKFGDTLDVQAFEPQPTLAARIRDSAVINGLSRVAVHEVLLSDQVGEGTLYVTRQAVHASLVARESRSTAIRREMTTLDGFIGDRGLAPPSLIKIDVEGAELQVFRGAAATIANSKPTIVFEADQNMERFGYNHAALVDSLRELADYEFLRIADTGALHRVTATEAMSEGNYVALPSARRHLIERE
ncbi:MAG TPA: FkbM family methyltransferase [Vineibacter sp.]|nr:FkbM family methyltransferase [Vineibacter sp.]